MLGVKTLAFIFREADVAIDAEHRLRRVWCESELRGRTAGSDVGDERSHRFLDAFVVHVFALEKPGALVIASEVA